jgi:hypothetical protein
MADKNTTQTPTPSKLKDLSGKDVKGGHKPF